MNNNRGNNRRRGRGNNRQQGGQQINRIDSRARGNAPQLLEKYRKLAHDAHLNGDRVTEEYYLQFADHYFRVIADQRQRQDEVRQQRRDDRPSDYGDDYGTDDDTYGEAMPAHGSGGHDRAPNPRYEREPRDEAPRYQREPRDETPTERRVEAVEVPENPEAAETPEGERSIYEPAANPFLRDGRGTRGLKERKPRRRSGGDDDAAPAQAESENEASTGNFDPATLPPSISTRPAAEKPAADEVAEEKPKRRRTRKAVPPADDADGKLETVNG